LSFFNIIHCYENPLNPKARPITPVKKLIVSVHNNINAEGIPVIGKLNSRPSIINNDESNDTCPMILNLRILLPNNPFFEYNTAKSNLNN
jgi:hypothetical protein|tara:strand:+ start:610 stop:879 length:270 start_codon:yes stop_codon:yes gene_type:complete